MICTSKVKYAEENSVKILDKSHKITLLDVIDHIRFKNEEIHDNLEKYILVTLHRPSNVDEPENLRSIINNLNKIDKSLPVIFPAHPRTRKILSENKLV